ncbi:MAG TPA: ribonuclease Z [Blastocatellia bacterium]|nr:ribonuclease Z [Blastocatellia bacterium]
MKLTIIGSGTVVPDGKRNSASYFIETADARIMLDCGAGSVHGLDRFGQPWQKMTHLFVSHFHVDHVGELASLFFAFKHGMRDKREEAFTLVGPRGLDRVMNGLEEAFGSDLFEPKFPVNVRLLDPGVRMQVGRDTWLAVAKTPHTDESLAVRIESEGRALCYTGDTEYGEELVEFFGKADLLISECSFRERKAGVRHLSIKDVATLASRAEVARLVVTHFYFDVDESELKSELQMNYSGEVIIGRDGLSLNL